MLSLSKGCERPCDKCDLRSTNCTSCRPGFYL